jgi:hypothetical protein
MFLLVHHPKHNWDPLPLVISWAMAAMFPWQLLLSTFSWDAPLGSGNELATSGNQHAQNDKFNQMLRKL